MWSAVQHERLTKKVNVSMELGATHLILTLLTPTWTRRRQGEATPDAVAGQPEPPEQVL